jgi:hypothetical protein
VGHPLFLFLEHEINLDMGPRAVLPQLDGTMAKI